MSWLTKKKTQVQHAVKEEPVFYSKKPTRSQVLRTALDNNFMDNAPQKNGRISTMDYSGTGYSGLAFGGTVPDALVEWYGNQNFIGFQTCMLFSQHWLINAACEIPVLDALRKGYDIKSNDGEDVDRDILEQIAEFDKTIKLNQRLINFGKFARVFGYRIAIFKIESDDPDYYSNPFNPDGITKDSYTGIALPDPYYITPELSGNFDPSDPDFYEPEYWVIQGKRYHKSHVVIFRHCEVASLLKPTYLYGGISLVQQIYEKCYSAEQASNEANRLLMTKRLMVRKGDVGSALLDQAGFEDKMNFFRDTRDNYGEQIIDTTEDLLQLETALAEVTNVISQKYEQVAAVARMPSNKLMQTQLQGFASSGEPEEAIYNGMLETLQENCFTEFLERHYMCALRSIGIAPFKFTIHWPPIDTITELEQAQINLAKAQSDTAYVQMGALSSGDDVRDKLANEPDSGYKGIKAKAPEELVADYGKDNVPEDSEPKIPTPPPVF